MVFEIVIAQAYPPTPTAYPAVAAPAVDIPLSSVGVWQSTDEVIGYWNLYGQYTQFVTYLLFALLIVATVFLLRRLFAQLTGRDT